MSSNSAKTADKTGHCCIRCGRSLSDPESIRRGFGPVCAAKIVRERESDEDLVELLSEGEDFQAVQGLSGNIPGRIGVCL
jgi:hypothetical protein